MVENKKLCNVCLTYREPKLFQGKRSSICSYCSMMNRSCIKFLKYYNNDVFFIKKLLNQHLEKDNVKFERDTFYMIGNKPLYQCDILKLEETDIKKLNKHIENLNDKELEEFKNNNIRSEDHDLFEKLVVIEN
jgi:hypothetical protein